MAVALLAAQRVDVLSLEELPPEEVTRLDVAGLRMLHHQGQRSSTNA